MCMRMHACVCTFVCAHAHMHVCSVSVCVCANCGVCMPQTKELPKIKSISNAAVLLNLGDSVTTDHISPAGSIARNSPAARYLGSRGSAVELCVCVFFVRVCVTLT